MQKVHENSTSDHVRMSAARSFFLYCVCDAFSSLENCQNADFLGSNTGIITFEAVKKASSSPTLSPCHKFLLYVCFSIVAL